MEAKSSKPLIVITAALSLAVITLSVQVVFLTFTVKDQKDSLRYLSSSSNVFTVKNKMNSLQNNLVDISREIELLSSDYSRMRDEVNAMQSMVSKASNDYQFLQQELINLNTRIAALEKHAANSEFILQGLESALTEHQQTEPHQNAHTQPDTTPNAQNQAPAKAQP